MPQIQMRTMPQRTVQQPTQQPITTPQPVTFIYDYQTKNQSFLTMHHYLKSKGY